MVETGHKYNHINDSGSGTLRFEDYTNFVDNPKKSPWNLSVSEENWKTTYMFSVQDGAKPSDCWTCIIIHMMKMCYLRKFKAELNGKLN